MATSASRVSAARPTRKRSGAAPDDRPERDAQGGLLRLGERVEPAEHRRAELMHSRERQLHLGLDSDDPGDSKSGRLPSAIVQERRLADARLATDDENCTLPAAHVRHQPVEHLTLAGPAQ